MSRQLLLWLFLTLLSLLNSYVLYICHYISLLTRDQVGLLKFLRLVKCICCQGDSFPHDRSRILKSKSAYLPDSEMLDILISFCLFSTKFKTVWSILRCIVVNLLRTQDHWFVSVDCIFPPAPLLICNSLIQCFFNGFMEIASFE